jgi:hypothetical protein
MARNAEVGAALVDAAAPRFKDFRLDSKGSVPPLAAPRGRAAPD